MVLLVQVADGCIVGGIEPLSQHVREFVSGRWIALQQCIELGQWNREQFEFARAAYTGRTQMVRVEQAHLADELARTNTRDSALVFAAQRLYDLCLPAQD